VRSRDLPDVFSGCGCCLHARRVHVVYMLFTIHVICVIVCRKLFMIAIAHSLLLDRCLPDSAKPDSPKPVSPKPDSPKLGFRVRVRVGVSANRVSAKRVLANQD